MKIYFGDRGDPNSGGPRQVFVNDGKGNVYPLPHVKKHSPDGFQWGYGGSGPADLALSILSDYFTEKVNWMNDMSRFFGRGLQSEKERSDEVKRAAERLYQAFKWAFISPAGEKLEIDEEQIGAWVDLEMLSRRETL
jgi:hypothetical protein